jgi:hypothetical protein
VNIQNVIRKIFLNVFNVLFNNFLFFDVVFFFAKESFVGAFVKLRKATVSFVLSVRPHGRTLLLPLDGFLWTFDIRVFFEAVSKQSPEHCWNII